MKSVEVERPREKFCDCTDCGKPFYSSQEFVDHLDTCEGKKP